QKMKLVIREYLSLLKEEGELDKIVGDLALSMSLTPLVKPKKGVRQHGVDIYAVGKDPRDGITKVFIFLIKQGNIDRNNWHANPQSVKPTLDEIIEIFIPKLLYKKYEDTPKVIVVCCNGDKDQGVDLDFTGYQEKI